MLFRFLCSFFFFYANVVLSTVYESNELRNVACDSTFNYTSNSTFSTNLVQALYTLQNSIATTGFSTTTAGNLIEPVTALALCRGGISPTSCQSCMDTALSGIRSQCPNQRTAQIWYDLCMVRYSGTNFIGKPNNNMAFGLQGFSIDAPDPDSYGQRVEYLMHNLSSTAASTDERYAVGRTPLLNLTVYGYVDCTRDVSSDDCSTCLLAAMDVITACCLTKSFGWILTPTCNFQFNKDPVHLDWTDAPLVKFETEAVAPTVMQIPPPAGGNGMAIKFLLGGAVVTVILVFGVLWAVITKARNRGKVTTDSSENGDENAEEMMKKEGIGMRPFLYDLDQLVVATNQFSPSHRLGRPGYHGGRDCQVELNADGAASKQDENKCFSVNSITTSLAANGR
ncbi:hypothetical protein F0562_005295 [Nyssa sinensis]|uniref:Gnk2-homologous domain-containing protein n=1 Tax=Nyssa sinensis TaxID=561372 RepID=A0A5J5ALQ4_9ASTE|nr:hypothetical protein F0562_005295 [Nyssa sinensis]